MIASRKGLKHHLGAEDEERGAKFQITKYKFQINSKIQIPNKGEKRKTQPLMDANKRE